MNRTIYTTSQLNINGTGFLVKSVSYDRPFQKETIEEFGSKGFLLAQNEPDVCTLDFSFYPTGSVLGGLFQDLKLQTESDTPTRVSVSSNVGSLQNALLTSLKGEASIGSVPTMSAKFIGAFDSSLSALSSPSTGVISSVPTTENITVNGTSCPQKVSFSWEVPVKAVPTYDESLTNPSSFFGDLPGKFAINIDQIQPPTGSITGVNFDNFTVGFSGHSIMSSGVSLAVGDLFATLSLSIEGPPSSVTFS